MKHHADLLDAAFWQGHKERILAGHVHDVFPYDAEPSASSTARTPLNRSAEHLSADSHKEPSRIEHSLADLTPIVIVSAARTPIGGLLGDFSSLAAWELGAVAIKAAVERAGVPGDAIDEVLMGNCLMAGQGQAPARQAMRKAGLPDSAGAVTLSKMCGSRHARDDVRARHARRRQSPR